MGKKSKKINVEDLKVKLSKDDLAFLADNTSYSKAEIKAWFKRFCDECPEGVLTKDDLHAMYATLLPAEDPTVIVNHLFRIFDRDNNGTIDFKEFVLATNVTTSGAPEEKLKWTFKMYDKDGSGTIDMSEMIEVLETVYIMEGVLGGDMAKDRAKQIFAELDENGDGTLTCEEFIAGCMKDDEMVEMLGRNNHDENEAPAEDE